MEDARERVIMQKSLFDEIINSARALKCKDCGAERKKYTQYCKPCAREREKQRKREYEERNRKKRRCANDTCNKVIVDPKGNAQKYCCDECKPNYQAQEAYKKKRIEDRERAKALMNVDKYEGTVPSKWIQPRGSKKRKEMGLEVSKFGLSKDSDTGGRFVY